jgi:hypothetical protein
MADSEAAMIMAKVHECKRKAHDPRDEAHTLTARAAITAVHLLAARGKICSLKRAAGERGQWPAVEIERALGQPRRAEWAGNFERAALMRNGASPRSLLAACGGPPLVGFSERPARR